MEKMWDNGFRQITSSTHPIVNPADLKGFKIRVPVSPLWTSMFQALGASPISINFSEVYSALQTKIAEGQENPLTLIEIAKLYEVQKYVSMTSHMWDGFWMLANKRNFAALPPDAQAIVTKELNRSALDERADIAKLNGSVADDLKSKGLVFVEVDKPAFRARPEIGRLLRRLEEEIRRRGLGHPGVRSRRAVLMARAERGAAPRRRNPGGAPGRWPRSACCSPASPRATSSMRRWCGRMSWPRSCSSGWPCWAA